MLKSSEDIGDIKVQELILSDQEAITTLQQEVARLRMFLELKALKSTAAHEHLADNLRRSDALLRKLRIQRENLQMAIETSMKARRPGNP